MPITDLYAVLGVGRKARSATIKKAYHAKSKIHHPDMPNGDGIEFERVKLAYDVLIDKARRAQYDEKGTYDMSLDHRRDAVLQLLADALLTAMKHVMSQKANMAAQDMIDIMRQILNVKMAEIVKNHEKHVADRGEVSAILGRFTVKGGGHNYLEDMVQTQVDAIDRVIDALVPDIELYQEALDMLDEYGFRGIERLVNAAAWSTGGTWTQP